MNIKEADDLLFLKKRFKIPLYSNMALTIVITNDMPRAFKKITGQNRPDDSLGLFFHSGDNNMWIIINTNEEYLSVPIAGLISHEAFHATKYIMDFVGMELNDGSEEAYAYLIQWISDKTNELLINYNNKYAE